MIGIISKDKSSAKTATWGRIDGKIDDQKDLIERFDEVPISEDDFNALPVEDQSLKNYIVTI